MNNEWISEHCFTKTGNLNNRVCLDSWWINRNLSNQLNYIHQTCQYLDPKATITEKLFNIFHDLKEKPRCKMCTNYTTFRNFKDGYRSCCSIQCSTKDPKRNLKISLNTSIETKKLAKLKTKATNLKRYGVEWTSKINVPKCKKTKLARYGSENYTNIEKRNNTMIQRYGTTNNNLIPSKKQKTKETQLQNGTLSYDLVIKEKFIELASKFNQREISSITGMQEQTIRKYYKKWNIHPTYPKSHCNSLGQTDIVNYIKALIPNINIEENNRKAIKPKHLDIYLPDYKLAIEYNGVFWHADNNITENFNKNKHLTKTELCNALGIRLIQIWSTEWRDKPDICKSIINNALGLSQIIYARKTIVQQISKEEYKQFMDENHIQGYVHADKCIGLYYNNTLVSAIGIAHSRYNKQYKFELVRAATKIGYNVIGGLSKLLKNSGYKEIFTYCDKRLFQGSGYEKVGFKFLYNTKPNYYYIEASTDKLLSRLKFQKHKLEKFFGSVDHNLTEKEIMKSHGWFQLYDCGNSAWVINF